MELLTSGAFARASGLSRKALRLYDELGLLGLRRAGNEDAAYAGARLLAVADGMGGHAAGEVASAAVIEALRPLDTQVPAGELLNALDHAVRRANSALRDMAQADPSLHGMGTTLTAEPDLQLLQARPGDRYLLCSDGLHAVVAAGSIAQVLLTVSDPDQAAKDLIALAIDGGGPDNVTCIVADVAAPGIPAAAQS